MAITAAMVKELRERTAAGMMDCKKALVEANGDMELAIENMRKSGAVKAAKKQAVSLLKVLLRLKLLTALLYLLKSTVKQTSLLKMQAS